MFYSILLYSSFDVKYIYFANKMPKNRNYLSEDLQEAVAAIGQIFSFSAS